MFCTQCGIKNSDDARFCKECGHSVEVIIPKLDEADFAMLQKPEDRVDDLLVQAFRKSELGDLDGAVESCKEALSVRPESTSAHSLLGMLYEKRGERDNAIKEFETVLALNPGSIADREKLEQLRDQTSVLTPRHIVTAHRQTGPTIFESPAGAFVAALAVFFLVLAAGGWALWAKTRTTETASHKPTIGSPLPLASTPWGQQQLVPTNPQLNNTGSSALKSTQNQPVAQQNQTAAQNHEVAATPPVRQRRTEPDVPPARVDIGERQLPNRFEMRQPQDTGNTVHLPDNNLAPSEVGPSPVTQTNAQRPNPGKIDIVVSQSNTSPRVGSSSTPAAPSDSSTDSRSRKGAAERARTRGDYRTATREYLKALDGAGDDAADIHYQLGRCYQFLEENDSAIAHYNDAIAEYKRIAASGKNADEANRQIRRCEAGIRACQ